MFGFEDLFQLYEVGEVKTLYAPVLGFNILYHQ